MSEPEIWFPAKRYGWGWGPPRVWQGWAVLAVYFALSTAALIFLAFRGKTREWNASILALTAGLCFICWLKGEKPRWRWGGKD